MVIRGLSPQLASPHNLATSQREGFRLVMTVPSIHAAGHTPSGGSVPAHPAASRTRNKILNLLPGKELDVVLERSEMVAIESEEVVFRRNEPSRFAYFPG